MSFACPVCGYVGLTEDPLKQTYEICPCCFTEFGNDDTLFNYESLRTKWIEDGMLWNSSFRDKPKNWNPLFQLGLAGFLDKIKVVCKHCKKERAEHAVKGLPCPIGKAHKTYGYMQYSAVTVFEPKVVKLRKPREKSKFIL